ncbi:hypothetical protein B6I54_10995 [Klebsiella pneumoniae]|nr:hypothetical protein B6I54_10995 [Klebsiella pneumoniae]
MFSDSTRMPFIETFMTFLLALTLLEISPGPDMMLTIATRSGCCMPTGARWKCSSTTVSVN